MKKCAVAHIITGLSTGGAEMMLYKLLSHMDKSLFKSCVISLSDFDHVGTKIEKLDVPVFALELHHKANRVAKLIRFHRLLRTFRPDIVQTWMYHADLLGSILTKMSLNSKTRIMWNIRHSDFDPRKEKLSTRIVVMMGSFLSHILPCIILCNSYNGKLVHKQMGYSTHKLKVIQNGFETDVFLPNPVHYANLRTKLKIPAESPIIGMVARYHYQKNHYGFFQAANIIKKNIPNANFVLCGKNIGLENKALKESIEKYKIGGCTYLLGQQDDINKIQAGFDVAVSNSTVGEGCPNVIGEAMSCGVPCVATDVGDSAYLIKDTGLTILPGDPSALAEACITLLRLNKSDLHNLGRAARRRICQHFSIKKIAKQYEQVYLSVANLQN
jgi:glycosyltransferase involved in cell wall biosynthesis